MYDQEWCVDLTQQEGNEVMDTEFMKEWLKNGKSWSDLWLEYWWEKYNYDDNFMAVSSYVKNNYINLDE